MKLYDTEFRTNTLTKEVKPPQEASDGNVSPEHSNGVMIFLMIIVLTLGGVVGFAIGDTSGYITGYQKTLRDLEYRGLVNCSKNPSASEEGSRASHR